MIVHCDNPATWHPTLHRNETHHNPPRSWTTDNGASAMLWETCGTCHNEIHALLNEYLRVKGLPSWDTRRTYGPWVRERAAEAWADRRLDKPLPYTSSAGNLPGDGPASAAPA